jgi:hypothetical protein
VHAEYLGDTDGAIGWLRKGLVHSKWETREVPDFQCRAYFNLACFLARKAAANPSQDLSQEVILALHQAADIGAISAEDVEREYGAKGDFNDLIVNGNATVKSVLASLRPRLSAHAE